MWMKKKRDGNATPSIFRLSFMLNDPEKILTQKERPCRPFCHTRLILMSFPKDSAIFVRKSREGL